MREWAIVCARWESYQRSLVAGCVHTRHVVIAHANYVQASCTFCALP
jgi:hypothetical protein